ncbi:MAG: Cro/Cl family transcriptional regulator, partial [Clostridia bacterium]|nr:Cro/Cl family transcriptional regulator [Clostridia bacterium]
MKVCYKKLWKLLIDKDLKRNDLVKNANISTTTLCKMGNNNPV